MGVTGINELKKLQKKLEQLEKKDLNNMYEYIARQVALRFLMYVIPDTPTQENATIRTNYKTYKIRGGALKRGWIGQTEPGPEPSLSEMKAYAEKLPVVGSKRKSVTITNNVEYASFVEYGHRQHVGQFVSVLKNKDGGYGARLTTAWVPGQYMLLRATKNVARMANGLVRKLANQWMEQYLE